MAREDFEIYEFERDGKKWYGFKVEYYGIYSSPSKPGILKMRNRVKEEVRKKLEWIEEENKKYYARMAKEERQRALLLKQAKYGQ